MPVPKNTSLATHPTQQTSLKFPSGIDRLLWLLVAAAKPENPGYFEVDLHSPCVALPLEGILSQKLPAQEGRSSKTRTSRECQRITLEKPVQW
ncbi:hypothetical protein [Microcoleus sp. herbarium14]|uniref:hypothetical protein n=1 Tax=Microcoleus sp. herbarium14 TaxID=3055439 RepID=UPI002FD0BF04